VDLVGDSTENVDRMIPDAVCVLTGWVCDENSLKN
jgi:hypothetical protein